MSKGEERPVVEWKSLKRVWTVLVPDQIQTGAALMLVGPKRQAEEKALELAAERSTNVCTIRPGEKRAETLVKQIEEWLDKNDTLYDKVELPVLVALELDHHNERICLFIKHRLESLKKRWLCISTAEDPQGIPDYCRGMLYEVKGIKKSGRPKKIS